MIKVGVIGSSGKNGLITTISEETYENMIVNCEFLIYYISKKLSIKIKDITVVSGGCSLSDHIAVDLFNRNFIDKLMLFLPCEFDFDKHQFEDNGKTMWYENFGGTLNNFHKNFSKQLNKNSLLDIENSIKKGAIIDTSNKGFHSRNSAIAKSDFLIAFSFGDGKEPDDGGTLDTWKKCKGEKIHISINNLI